jgi:transposase
MCPREEYQRLRPSFPEEGHAFVETLLEALEAQQTELSQLKRAAFGQKAEPKPRLNPPAKPTPTAEEWARREAERLKSREHTAQQRAQLPTEPVEVPLPPEAQVCPQCAGTTFRKLPDVERKIEYDFVAAHLKRREIRREKWACVCGHCILTAPPLPSVGTGSAYSPRLHAHIVVAKCADSLPLYRQEKILARAGVAVDRNTLIDLFHRGLTLSADSIRGFCIHSEIACVFPWLWEINSCFSVVSGWSAM